MNIENPLSEKELKQGDLIPKGVYQFQVVSAEDTISKSSNKPMIKLQLKVWLEDGRERMVFDNLMESVPWKLGHFCEIAGLMDQYNNKRVNDYDCNHKNGWLKIGIQIDKSGQYPDKNNVVDYITEPKASALNPLKPLPKAQDDFNDEIPF